MVFADRNRAADLDRQPEEPLEEVEVVRTLVQQHAAALSGPGRAPRTAVVIALGTEPVGDGPVDPDDFAEFAVFDHLLDLPVRLAGALVEHEGETEFGVLRVRVNHLLRPALGHRDRLLAEHGESLFERLDRNRRVVVVRHRNDDRVDRAGVQKVVDRVEHPAARRSQLHLLIRARPVPVADRCKLRLRNVLNARDV